VLVLSKKRDAASFGKIRRTAHSLVGAASKSLVSGRDALPGKANYFIGRDPSKWRSNVPNVREGPLPERLSRDRSGVLRQPASARVRLRRCAGADPSKIVLGFKGAKTNSRIDAEAISCCTQ